MNHTRHALAIALIFAAAPANDTEMARSVDRAAATILQGSDHCGGRDRA